MLLKPIKVIIALLFYLFFKNNSIRMRNNTTQTLALVTTKHHI